MPEIWSLTLTTEGISACSLNPAMESRQYSQPWPLIRKYGVQCVDSAVVLRMTARALHEISQGRSGEVKGIALLTPELETAVFVDSKSNPASPVFIESPLTIPKSGIPEKYAEMPETSKVYRNSVLRRLQQFEPTFGMNGIYGIWSLGALVMHGLCGNALDACSPRGMKIDDIPDDMDEMIWQAMGINHALSSRRVRPGVAAARISGNCLAMLPADDFPELFDLAGTPVFCMGTGNGAASYAMAANALSWAVTVGTRLSARWNAGNTALSAYEIQIIDTPAEAPTEPKEMTSNEWTQSFDAQMPLNTEPGPGKTLTTYGYSTEPFCSPILMHSIQALLDQETGRIAMKALKSAPVGSCGLRCIFGAYGWQITGLHSAHEPAQLARALFEGMLFELRAWRETVCNHGLAPVRICIEKPWPTECAQWAADILGESIYYIDDTEGNLASFGGALALMRSLGIDLTAKPRLQANVLEPSGRCESYQPHYAIHRYLKENQ